MDLRILVNKDPATPDAQNNAEVEEERMEVERWPTSRRYPEAVPRPPLDPTPGDGSAGSEALRNHDSVASPDNDASLVGPSLYPVRGFVNFVC